jgi:hypothetical protein
VAKGTYCLWEFGGERRGLTSIQLAVTDDVRYYGSIGVFKLYEGQWEGGTLVRWHCEMMHITD